MTHFHLVVDRRHGAPMQPGRIYLDLRRRTVGRDGHTVRLEKRVFSTLVVLASNIGVVCSQWEIFYNAWDIAERDDGGPLCVRDVVSTALWKLRHKLKPLGLCINSMHSRGWYLSEEPKCAPRKNLVEKIPEEVYLSAP